MLTKDFDYNLPADLIAQTPATPRDSSRLMVVDRNQQTYQDKHFFEIIEYFQEGDLLVWNNSKVFKARLYGRAVLNNPADGIEEQLEPTGKIMNASPVEIFLVRPMENPGVWKVLAKPGRRLRLGMKVQFAPDFMGEVLLKEEDGTLLMQFGEDDLSVRAKANKYGEVPTPPYVSNKKSKINNQDLSERYQTVYAKHEGSVAAPTAGFHFTPELIEQLKRKGVQFAEVTLHVGLGTFLPVKTVKIEDHHLHSEWVELTAKNADLITAAKVEGRRVVAVGTTTVRTLEGVAKLFDGNIKSYTGDLNIFIVPGFKFQVVDALITNFHLPESTLLMLVSVFAEAAADKSVFSGREFILQCYQKAIEKHYRFYSFGDAMLIK